MALWCHKESPMTPTEKRPDALRSFVDSVVVARLTASWRNNAIHAQVLYHLTVVIEAVPYNQCGHAEARGHAFAKGAFDGVQQVTIVDSTDSFVDIGERVLKEFHNIRFGLH